MQEAMEREWAVLQLDDRIFRVLRSTIHANAPPDSLLPALFPLDGAAAPPAAAGPPPLAVFRDATHPLRPVVLDRSPVHFAPVLHFLRTGELVVDPGVSLRGVLLEAQYFGVDAVVQQLAHIAPADFDAPRAAADRCTEYTRRDLEMLAVHGTLGRLVGLQLVRADFSGLDLSGARFERCALRGANFAAAILEDVRFKGCDLSDACFTGAQLQRSTIHTCTAHRADFTRAQLCGARCGESDFTAAVICEANCAAASFAKAVLINADATRCCFLDCDLTEVNMSFATLSGADFTRASMHRAILRGVEREGANLAMGGVIH